MDWISSAIANGYELPAMSSAITMKNSVVGIDKNTVISTIKKNGCSRPSQPQTVRVDAGWWRGSQGASGL